MATKRRIISCALTGVLAASTAAAFAGCDALTGANVIWVAFAETGYGRAFLEQWCEDFKEKYPNMDYEFQLEGEPTMTAEIGTRLATDNEVPDIFFSLDTNWQEWAARGYLAELDAIYQTKIERGNTIAAFMNEGLRDYGRVNGHYYVIPWTDGANGLIYNHTMFEQNGWKVPETVDELYALCDQIKALPCNNDADKNNDIAPFAWSGKYASYWDFLVENWWAQYEGADAFQDFFNFGAPRNEDGTFKFENDQVSATDYGSPEVYLQEGRVQALEIFSNLVVNEANPGFPKNSISGAVGAEYTVAQLAFINGKAAMMPNGAWLEQEMANVMPDGFEMRMMRTPYLEGAQKDPATGEYIPINASSAGDFFCVPKNAPNIEAAMEFMKYINSREACETFTRMTGGLRPFQYVDELDLNAMNLSNFSKSCIELYRTSKTVYHYSSNPIQWVSIFGKWPDLGNPYVGMISGEYTAAEACSKCATYVYNGWWDSYKLVTE